MRNLLLCLCALFVVSCGQTTGDQIEKCVQSGVQAGGPYKNSQDKAETEFEVRVVCLRAATEKE